MTAIKVASDLKIFSDNRVIMCDIVDNKISIVAYEKDLKEYEKYKESFNGNLSNYSTIKIQESEDAFDCTEFYNVVKYSNF